MKCKEVLYMLSKYVFLGNCLTHPMCREAMIKYIQGRFKPGSEDNFINGLLGEYVAEVFLKNHTQCKGLHFHINDKQNYIYSKLDHHQYLEHEPDFWIGEVGYDVKSTAKSHFSNPSKRAAVEKAKDENATYVVLLMNFNYHDKESQPILSIESLDGQVVLEETIIPCEFVQKCFEHLIVKAVEEEIKDNEQKLKSINFS